MPLAAHAKDGLDIPDVGHAGPAAAGAEGIDELWARIVAHQGEKFVTVSRIEFRYSVRGNILRTDRADWNMSRSTFETALAMMPVSGPGALNKVVQGPAYVFAILTDQRIRLH